MPPHGVLVAGDIADRLALGLFLFSGLGTGVLGEARGRAETALAALRDRQAEFDRQRELLDTLFNTSPAGLALLGADGRYMRVNAALAALNGLPAADHVGKTIAEAGSADPAAGGLGNFLTGFAAGGLISVNRPPSPPARPP